MLQGVAVVPGPALLAVRSLRVMQAAEALAGHPVARGAVLWVDVVVAQTLLAQGPGGRQVAIETGRTAVTARTFRAAHIHTHNIVGVATGGLLNSWICGL